MCYFQHFNTVFGFLFSLTLSYSITHTFTHIRFYLLIHPLTATIAFEATLTFTLSCANCLIRLQLKHYFSLIIAAEPTCSIGRHKLPFTNRNRYLSSVTSACYTISLGSWFLTLYSFMSSSCYFMIFRCYSTENRRFNLVLARYSY